MQRTILFSIALSLMMSACNNKIPREIIQPEQMKSIIWDMLVAEQIRKADTSAATRLHLKDSITRSYAKILAINKISEAKYKKSLNFYEAHADIMNELMDSVNAYGKVLNDSLNSKMSKTKKALKAPLLKDSIAPKNKKKIDSALKLNHFHSSDTIKPKTGIQ